MSLFKTILALVVGGAFAILGLMILPFLAMTIPTQPSIIDVEVTQSTTTMVVKECIYISDTKMYLLVCSPSDEPDKKVEMFSAKRFDKGATPEVLVINTKDKEGGEAQTYNLVLTPDEE